MWHLTADPAHLLLNSLTHPSLPLHTLTHNPVAPPLLTPPPSPQGYLWTLKCCHGGADMDTAAEMAKGNLDGDTCWMLFDMLKNRWVCLSVCAHVC